MKGFLVVAARDALPPAAAEGLLAALRDCVRSSPEGVLLLVDSLSPAGTPPPAPEEEPQRVGLLVVGGPPPYDGRPHQALALVAPREPDDLRRLTAWLGDGERDLVDLPLELSGLLREVTRIAPRSLAPLAGHPGGAPRQRGREA